MNQPNVNYDYSFEEKEPGMSETGISSYVTNENDFQYEQDHFGQPGLISEEQIAETIENEAVKAGTTCEGRTCWAKTVLNKLAGLNLTVNNTLDEPTKNALSDFQAKKGLTQTRQIDAVTERALLEADALQRTKGTVQDAAAIATIATAKTKIEDWTAKGISGVKNKPQHILNSFRDPRKLWAFVLHQMAFKRMGRVSRKYSDPESYVNTGAHFCILLDGRIIQLHPFSRMIWHGNCVSPRSVAVEFEGNFPNVKGRWWIDKESSFQNKDIPTQAQFDAGRFLTSYLKVVLGTTHILAHRQSSDSRENDPGPDIWYNVGEWAISNLGMTDGGPAYKCGTGNPILPEWRTWANKTSTLVNKEYDEGEGGEEEIVWEDIDNESTFSDTEMTNKESPEQEDFLFEENEILTDTAKAVRLNRYYADKLGWNQYHDQINNLLLPYSGQQNVSLGEEAFAQAAASWQQQQGLSADGVIGPGTWARMKPLLVSGTVNPQPPPAPVPTTTGTGSVPSLGTLGKLLINTSVPALSKSYPEYQFTSEDAIWLARFVEGEAGGQDNADSHAVIWAMFNRFGILRHRVPSWTSLAVFLQKYSTTLQPLLNSRGAAERVWMNHNSNPTRFPVVSSDDTYPGTSIKKVQYQRHIDLQKKPWSAFQEYVRNMILKIMTGQIPNPGIGVATDFDSTYVFLKVARRKQGISGEPTHEEWKQYTIEHAKAKKVIWIGEKSNLNQKKNAFYIQLALKDVPADAVKIGTGSGSGEVMYEESDEMPESFTDYTMSEVESMETPALDNYTLAQKLDKVSDWRQLLLFKVPDSIIAGLKARSMFVQYAHNESYSNDLNIDFYRLRISKYPTVNGVLMNAASLIKYIRININKLVDTSYCDWNPYNIAIDGPVWFSDNPTGAVMKQDIKGPDNASVVVSVSNPTGWRFTTVHTPATGDHPVSGHREFFIGKDSVTGGTYFVIKGLDMMSTGIAGMGLPLFGSWGFGQADALWKSMRSKIIQFIKANGGSANEDMTYSERVEWRYVYHRYKNALADTFGAGAGSASNSPFFDFQSEFTNYEVESI